MEIKSVENLMAPRALIRTASRIITSGWHQVSSYISPETRVAAYSPSAGGDAPGAQPIVLHTVDGDDVFHSALTSGALLGAASPSSPSITFAPPNYDRHRSEDLATCQRSYYIVE